MRHCRLHKHKKYLEILRFWGKKKVFKSSHKKSQYFHEKISLTTSDHIKFSYNHSEFQQ